MDAVTVTGQALVLFNIALVGLLLAKLTRLETTLACLAAGIAASFLVPILGIETGIRADNIQDLIFYVILPLLIFEAAWHIKPAQLAGWLPPILLLAIIGVLLSTLITAAGVFFGINHPGFPWIAALLTGVILAATDPIAVVAKLKAFNAPEDLATLVEGESLFNDASAIVLFGVILGIATEPAALSVTAAVGQFAQVFVGGLVLGLISGLVAAVLVLFLSSAAAANGLLVLSALASFYVSEHVFHVSGVMAVMMSALVSRKALHEQRETILASAGDTWDWLGYWFNALIFALMGLVITLEMFTQQWLAIIIAIIASLVARFLAVSISCQLSGLMNKPVPNAWRNILVIGGLRGAIAIALVLSLPTSLPYWWTIQSMVFGVVLFTIIVQGPVAGRLIARIESS